MKAFLDKYLDPAWPQWHQLWSMRIALGWMVLSGFWMALPVFQNVVPPVFFALLCIACSLAIGIARLTKQPGVTL